MNKRAICLLLLGLAASTHAADPELPRALVDTRYLTPPGSTTAVASGANLQTAINSAACGDVLELEAGATFTGNFTLPNKNCTDTTWVYIRTDTPDGTFPRPGNRIGPSDASLMAKLTASTGRILDANTGADHYRFIGLEITPGAFLTNLIVLGDEAEATESNLPTKIIFDRCYIHGHATNGSRRGLSAQGSHIAVIDSYLSDFKEVGADTQALATWNGPGPIKLVNNHLEASGENLIFGGADPAVTDLVPSDIEIRRNHFFKPLTWNPNDGSYAGTTWTVKNLIELKNARRVLIENNLFENCWAQAQNGQAVLFSVKNQESTAPWSTVEDVTFRGNLVRNAKAGFSLSGWDTDSGDSQVMSRIYVGHNVFSSIGGTNWGAGSIYFMPALLSPHIDVSWVHNTSDTTNNNGLGAVDWADTGVDATSFVMDYNIVQNGSFGLKGSGFAAGTATLNEFFTTPQMTNNLLVGATCGNYPNGNTCPANMAAVGFVDYGGGDLRLDSASSYDGTGDNGTDLGAWVPASISAESQLDWGIKWQGDYTSLIVRFGYPGLDQGTSCDVRYGASSATSTSGPSTREVVLTGLSNGSTYAIMVDCGTEGGAISYDIFTGVTVPGGTVSIPITLGDISGTLGTVARATVDYGTTTAVSDGSVQNTSCATGRTINVTLSRGVMYYRWRWQTAGDVVLATSAVQPLAVQ